MTYHKKGRISQIIIDIKMSEGKKIEKTDDEWKKELSPEAYAVLRKAKTERAFSGIYHDTKDKGIYRCVGCGAELFSSDAKFDSGTGWPSFTEPIENEAIGMEEDRKFFMHRTEVHCNTCKGHLGHVFDDGPGPTKKRFCMNSASFSFEE